MSTFLNSLKVTGIAIAVAVLGGIAQALTNFHPTDQVTALIMTTFGGIVIGLINALMHKLQGTTVVPTSTITTTATPTK